MALLRPLRLLLLVVAGLFPALACALNETYDGMLEPQMDAPKIPIVVVLKDLGISLEGTVTTSAPYEGSAAIDSGANAYGQCTVNADLTKNLSLRLYGRCDTEAYSGSYILWDKQKRSITRGNFYLPRKAPEPVKLGSKRTATTSSCLKANAQCLIACPRDNETSEFLCTNRCRTMLQKCRGKAKKTAPLPPEEE